MIQHRYLGSHSSTSVPKSSLSAQVTSVHTTLPLPIPGVNVLKVKNLCTSPLKKSGFVSPGGSDFPWWMEALQLNGKWVALSNCGCLGWRAQSESRPLSFQGQPPTVS